ncbi:MAG: hypothetical protein WA840_00460 [Caulobacteraceae bacterium]
MTIGISSDVLLAYLQARTGQTGINSSTSAAATLASSAPTAPWNVTTSTKGASTTSTVPNTTSLVASLLDGQSIVNPTNTKLSTTTSNAAANSDYQNLFALYSGLTSLQTLATAAGASNVNSSQLSQYEAAFTAGLAQVRNFITSGPFKEFQVSNGTIETQEESTTGAQQESDTYTTQPLVSGSADNVVAAFQGDVSFSMTATTLQNQSTTVNFDLSQMGSTPRTLANVVTYLNSQLSAAGLKTRFSDELIPGTSPTSSTTNGVTITTPGTPDQFALQVDGTPNEQLSFSAPSSSPAVYIAQTSTDPSATSSSSTTSTTTTSTAVAGSTSGTSTAAPTTTSQVVKLDPSTDGDGSTTRGFTDDLPTGSTVTATATAPDGSLYVLANVTGPINGQPIQGQQDATLLKYDSAGNLVYTRTLGAAATADATALTVSADGSQVAIAGSITGGTLDPTDTSQNGSTTQQSFVTVFDSSGDQLWSQTQDAGADNQVNAVAFGANNSVYVAGSTQGSLPGGNEEGTQDAYIQGFSATSTTNQITQETTWTAASTFTTQFGTTGINRATGIAVEGSSVYVSSVLNGDAVVQQYALQGTNAPTLAAQQDLGNVDGGDVAGLAIAADGSIVVAGSTHNAALNAGTITSAYSGNGDAFVADLNANLDPTGSESVAYYNGGAPTTASALTISGGQVYITGQLAGATPTTGSTGYAAALSPTNGQVSWSTTFTGNNGSSEPASIAVGSNGSSVLDLFGLPQGPLLQQQQPSQLVVSNSSVLPGDKFYVQNGSGSPVAVTIAADDTYETLAQKIEQASGFQATVTTVTINNQQEIKITPGNSSAKIRLEAGPSGGDALSALGLQEGLLTTTANTTTSSATTNKTSNGQTPASNVKTQYQITVPADLSLDSSSDVTTTQNALNVAIAEVKQIYTDLTTPKTSTTRAGSGSGTVPAYITAQIANYNLALQRLTSGSSSSGSSSAALSILEG